MYSDAENLLSEHPAIETVEALITDCNGAARGKWLPIEKLPALMTEESSCPNQPSLRIFGAAMCRALRWKMATSMAGARYSQLTGASARQPRRRQSTSYPEHGQG